MQTVEKNADTKVQTKAAVRARVARWRLGSDDYLETMQHELPPPPGSGGLPADVPTSTFDNSRELGNVVQLALMRTKDVLELPMDPDMDPEEVNARGRVLMSAARTALQTQLRADSNVLKRTAKTQHSRLLSELKALKGNLDARTIDAGVAV